MFRFIYECCRLIRLAWSYRHLKCGLPSNYAKVQMQAVQLCMDLRKKYPKRCFVPVPASNLTLDCYGSYVGIWEVVRRDVVSGGGWPILVPLAFGPVTWMGAHLLKNDIPEQKSGVHLIASSSDVEAWKQKYRADGKSDLSNHIWHISQPWLVHGVNELIEQIENDVLFHQNLERDHDIDEASSAV